EAAHGARFGGDVPGPRAEPDRPVRGPLAARGREAPPGRRIRPRRGGAPRSAPRSRRRPPPAGTIGRAAPSHRKVPSPRRRGVATVRLPVKTVRSDPRGMVEAILNRVDFLKGISDWFAGRESAD